MDLKDILSGLGQLASITESYVVTKVNSFFFFPLVKELTLFSKSKAYAEYSVEELVDMGLWNRLKLMSWNIELLAIGAILIYTFLFKIGDIYNRRKVTSFLNSLNDVFKKNFFQYGVSENSLFVKDSPENYASYATGRINIDKVNISIRLQPRQNIFIWLFENVFSFFLDSIEKSEDVADFTITTSSDVTYDNFIAAIVSKAGMNNFRNANYFLSLTKTTDSPKLPQSFVFMSETQEFLDKILTDVLRHSLTPESASYLRYIAFTDQQEEKPKTISQCRPQRRVVLSTFIPKNCDQSTQLSVIVGELFRIIDLLNTKKITFKPESLRKVLKTRESELAKIQKLIDEGKQELLNSEKAKLKRDEIEKTRHISREEQIKLEKKAQEKKQRKLQKKQKVKM